MSLALRLMNGGLRRVVKPFFARTRSFWLLRWGLVVASLGLPLPCGVVARRESLGGCGAVWFTPAEGAAGLVLLWLHGGAHVSGSAFTHRGMLGRLARAAGCAVVAPEVRLAPEHELVQAQEDAERVFLALTAKGIVPERIVLGGDSSGGGLALALLLRLQARGLRVAGLVLLSPWLDMTLSGASIQSNAARDPVIPAARMAEAIEEIRGAALVDGPVCSPLFAAYRADCPALVSVGASEVLRDDSRRFAAIRRQRGGRVDLAELPDAPHVLAFFAPWLPEAQRETGRIGQFLRGLPGGLSGGLSGGSAGLGA